MVAIALSAQTSASDPFFVEDASSGHSAAQQRLIVDLDGFAGPLDMLLELARGHKVDLSSVSILGLSEQYLEFVYCARDLHIDLAADYLVMAAWLAYLKSRLLVPQDDEDEEPTGEELAQLLRFQLKRLKAMQEAGEALGARAQLSQERHPVGRPVAIKRLTHIAWQADYLDLLKAYAQRRQACVQFDFKPVQRQVFSVQAAREMLGQLLSVSQDWQSLQGYLASQMTDKVQLRSAVATGFSVSLELARQGKAELSQSDAFAPLYIRTPRAQPIDMSDQHIA